MIIRTHNQQKEFPDGATVQACLKGLDAFPTGTLAALSGGVVRELNEPLRANCDLEPLTLEHEEGRRVYERSLRFVMLLALRHLYPYQQVRIEYSVGYGVFVRLPGVELHRQDIVRLENEMRRLVELDLAFTRYKQRSNYRRAGRQLSGGGKDHRRSAFQARAACPGHFNGDSAL